MIESKVISDDVKELLENVRDQADKYSELYNKLENFGNDINSRLGELNGLSDEIKQELKRSISDLNNKYEESIKSLENSVQTVSKLELNLKEFEEEKEKIDALSNTLDEKFLEFSKLFKENNSKVNSEIEKSSKDLKKYVDETVTSKSKEVENRLQEDIQNLKSELSDNKNRVDELSKMQESKANELYERFKIFEELFENLNKSSKKISRKVTDDIRNIEIKLLEKIDDIASNQKKLKDLEFIEDIVSIDEAIKNYKEEAEERNKNIITSVKRIESQFVTLQNKYNSLNSDIDVNKKIATMAIVTAIAAILFSISMVLL